MRSAPAGVGRALTKNLTAIVAALLISFSLILFNPMLVYFSDPGRLGILPSRFVIQQLLVATCVALGLALPVFKLGRRYALALVFGGLVVFFYSYVIQIGFGLFRGNRFSNEDALFETARLAYWIEPVGLVLAFLLVRLVFYRNRQFFAVFYAILLLTVGYEVASEANAYRLNQEWRNRRALREPPKTLLRFSASQPNIVLFVPDAAAGYVVPQLMEENDRAARFDGFVNYRNTVSVGSYTMSSLAALIGGDRYFPDRINERNDQTLSAHIKEAYNWLADTLRQHDYETTFVNPSFIKCADIDHAGRCVESSKFKQGLESRSDIEPLEVFDEKSVLYFAAFKALPFSLKSALYTSEGWKNALDSDMQLAASVNQRFFEFLFLRALPRMSAIDEQDRSQFIHLWSPQLIAPFNLNEGCEPLAAGRDQLYSNDARTDSTRCLLDALSGWFDWMKANGVYDNTKIIIAADHGSDDYGQRWHVGAANPMLMVKDFRRRGRLETSGIVLQNSDVAALICSALGGCPQIKRDPVQHPIPNRTARYFHTGRGNKYWATANRQFDIIEVYEVQGDVREHPDLQ